MKLFKRTHITVRIISSEFVIWLKCRNWARNYDFMLWQEFYLFIYLDIFLVTFFLNYFFLVAQVKQQLAAHISYYWEKHDLLVITIASYRLEYQDCHTFLAIMVIIYTLMIRYHHFFFFFFLLWELISSTVNKKFNSRIALLAINTILQMTTWTTSSKMFMSSY